MKKFTAVLFAAGCISLAVACGSNGPTVSGPDPVTVSAPEPQPVAPVAVTPKPVVPGTGAFSVTYFQNAGFQVTNLSGETKNYYAYYTSFDNQTTALGVINGLYTKNGKDFTGSFNKTCVQLDLTEEATVVGGPGGRAFAYAYFDKQGKEISPANREAKINECRQPDPRPTPTPEPSPSPSPNPQCEPSWTSQEPVITFGDFAPKYKQGNSCYQKRDKRTVVREINSCTEETRVKSDVTVDDTKEVDCDTFCHVAANGTPSTAQDFGAIKIQTTPLKEVYPNAPNGHILHLTPSDQNGLPVNGQCPQDFWAINGKTCDNATAFSEILGIQGYDYVPEVPAHTVYCKTSTYENSCKNESTSNGGFTTPVLVPAVPGYFSKFRSYCSVTPTVQ